MKKILLLLFGFTIISCGGSDDDNDTNEESQTLRESLDGQVWIVDRIIDTDLGQPDIRDNTLWFYFPEGETSIIQIGEGPGTVNGFACAVWWTENEVCCVVDRNDESVFQVSTFSQEIGTEEVNNFTLRDGELILRMNYFGINMIWYCSLTSSTYESMGCPPLTSL